MSGPGYGEDVAGIEKRCVCCDTPTQSHSVPNGYLCHSCLTDREEDEIFDCLGTGAHPDLAPDTVMTCSRCGNEHTLREADAGPGMFLRVIIGRVPFDSLSAEVVVSCPRCTKATEYLTAETAAETVVEATSAKQYRWSASRGLVEE